MASRSLRYEITNDDACAVAAALSSCGRHATDQTAGHAADMGLQAILARHAGCGSYVRLVVIREQVPQDAAAVRRLLTSAFGDAGQVADLALTASRSVRAVDRSSRSWA